MKKWVKILLIVLVSLVLIYFITKFIFIRYVFSDYEENNINFNETYHLNKIEALDYFEMNGIKIRNDFKDYKLYNGKENTYYKSENGNVIQMFKENIVDYNNLDGEINEDIIIPPLIEKLTIKLNKFNNEYDVYKFAYENRNTKITIFTSYKKIFGYIFSKLLILGPVTMIEGDYNGIVKQINNSYEILLYNGNMKYTILLYGNDMNDEYVFDIINTIQID